MAQLVHRLVGYPPDVHVVMAVCDLLLLLHPAASAFVFHTADSFYFSDKTGEAASRQDRSESASLQVSESVSGVCVNRQL